MPICRSETQTHAGCVTLAKSIFTPGPWLEETETFFTNVPFCPCGFAFSTASTKALMLPAS
jgi:hypothetical protein